MAVITEEEAQFVSGWEGQSESFEGERVSLRLKF